MSIVEEDRVGRRATWRVAAARPRGAPYLPSDAGFAVIEATATEEARSWSVPAGALQDGYGFRSEVLSARRIPARMVPQEAPTGDAGWVPDDADSDDAPAWSIDPPGEGPAAGDDEPTPHLPRPGEHGDRDLFLALARQRLAGGIPRNIVHPPPPRSVVYEPVPEPGYTNLDPDDLLATFARSVEEAGGVCHQVVGQVPDALLDQLVAELEAWDVVVSDDPEARAIGERLADRGVDVSPAEREPTAQAAAGVTSAVAAIAATGSVVLDSARSGGRLSSVLPPAHVCVLPVERLVATPADVLRRLGEDPDSLPSSLVLVTGPSRTGDIEQLLTIGAHGPVALHVIVVTPPPPET